MAMRYTFWENFLVDFKIIFLLHLTKICLTLIHSKSSKYKRNKLMNSPILPFMFFWTFPFVLYWSSGFHIYICFSFPVKRSKQWPSLPVSKDLLSVWGRGGVLGWWAPAWLSLARLHWRLLSTRISYWPKELGKSH